ncbi:MAG: hypothetical protein J6V41_05525 [Kiritimatiellae bacterium]|nr:hypothetical protein [Kiritimatiellia bacterium]
MMTGAQFVNVGGANASLADLFICDNIPYGTRVMFATETGAYDTIKYVEEAYDELNDDFVPGWANGEEYLVSDTIAPGSGFWVIAPSAIELTQLGEVVKEDSVTITIPANIYTMVANPFPKGLNPNDAIWSENLPYRTQLMTLNSDGSYTTYRYLEEAYDEANDDFIPGWGNGEEYLITEPITSAGDGVWILTTEEISVTFTK